MDRRVRIRAIEFASWIAIVGNAFLAAMKVSVGFYSGSQAVVGDGLDSTTDIAISAITLITARIISRPPSPDYPYGHHRAETISTKILSYIILFVGAQFLYSNLMRIIRGEEHPVPTDGALFVTLISILGKLILAFILFRIGKRIESSMIIANAKNMKNDILTSVSVLTGLGFTCFLNLPVLDLITAVLIGLWIMWVAYRISEETNVELMDGMKDSSLYFKIFEAVESVPGASNPHRVRVRRLSNLYAIDLDIEVDPEVTVKAAHDISVSVETKIKECIPNIYDIMVHVEPCGNVEHDEKYGLSRNNISL